ncbi:hypothetical protein ASPZODRAFT_68722 [Penicilliopsis zonata CBS 506.65]|uniref:DOC domain-containing protein n=1 Tax=Penicilliopsis zonata CBS 506.65 TaxID=1073090 RepID=A0A1L9SEX6_9EURO|nr:hypothetical protein ASPZODRAFT_68722 [Penicilliopsis zonata CBS 506.65]OJJ45698.1 hypothetical protein ASPZODRAFT_68722 [Penicilliopsis zonata CBS 506.65]
MPRNLLRRHPAPSAREPVNNTDPDPETPQLRSSRARPAQAVAHQSFQTPPQLPAASLPPQLLPSSGPTLSHPAAAAQAALTSMFGRGGPFRNRRHVQMMDEDDFEEEEHEAEAEYLDDEQEGSTQGPDVTFEGDDDEEAPDADEMIGDELGDDEDLDAEDIDDLTGDRERSPSPLPTNLREISSLASWTVSTHKPGCGVAALRNPSPSQYWQSDGPQPHTLTLHFFKLVAVVKIRVYLDFDLDESYTPTKMIFLAGMGGNDLVEFAIWEGEGPCGWVDIPLDGVGGRNGGWASTQQKRRRRRLSGKGHSPRKKGADDYLFSDSDDHGEYHHDDTDEAMDDETTDDDADDKYSGNVLKAMVIQMRVMENHQNGKDTHVRGFQVFACDEDRRRIGTAPSASASTQARKQSIRKSLRAGKDDDMLHPEVDEQGDARTATNLEEPDWMGEPIIR